MLQLDANANAHENVDASVNGPKVYMCVCVCVYVCLNMYNLMILYNHHPEKRLIDTCVVPLISLNVWVNKSYVRQH